MTHAEIKAAFMDECPVMFNGVRYRRISALIYRKNPTGTGLVKHPLQLHFKGRFPDDHK